MTYIGNSDPAMKIIHVMPSGSFEGARTPENLDDIYSKSWAARYVVATQQRSDKYDQAVSQSAPYGTYRRFHESAARTIDGVDYTMFPAITTKNFYRSVREIRRLLREHTRKEDVLFHIQLTHHWETSVICHYFKRFPIIVTHRGTAPPLYKYKQTGKKLFLLRHHLEKRMFRHVDEFFGASKPWVEEMSTLLGRKLDFFHASGTDFERFSPMDKTEAREMLGLPGDAKIMMLVSGYGRKKGQYEALKAFEELKKSYDIRFLFVGSTKNADPEILHLVEKLGVDTPGYVPHERLPLYYSASDVYVLSSFHERNMRYGGIGGAPREAMACNTPSVSTFLYHFPGSMEERDQLGKVPERPEDVAGLIAEVLEEPEQFRTCRETAKKYYSWDVIIPKTIEFYDALFEKYYG